ncbi:hypothetical protein ACHAWC_004914 [Mediolabrus comicus]
MRRGGMMTSTAIILALYATLLHIMYIISFASGFLILPLPHSSTLHYQQDFHDSNVMILQATRQADILTSSTQRITPRPLKISNNINPFNNNNNSQQQTQFFKDNVLVNIHRTSSNSRRISGEMIMNNVPIDIIWDILTDYDNLCDHVPNLVESRVIDNGADVVPRVYQKGAQRIFGFEFGADVTLDMREHISSRRQVIDFKCVDSQFFSEFDGSWIVEEYNTEDDDLSSYTTSTSEPITIVRYIVDVRPKGVVPVAALEWRIKEDVPVNIVAVAKAATAAMERHQQELLSEQQGISSSPITDVPPQGLQKDPSSSTRRSPRRRQPLFQQPLQRLTNQAANNLKQTAKSILPKPVISTAKQAINIINNNSNNRRRIEAPLPMVSRLQTTGTASSDELKKDFTGSSSSSSSSNDMEVDWYDDETMAMYL